MLLHRTVSNAQTFRGTILGTVVDSSGAAVPGVTVTIKNVDTGLTRTALTSDDGSYSAPELPIDFTLQPGQLAQTVEVVGEELPMVESTSNTQIRL